MSIDKLYLKQSFFTTLAVCLVFFGVFVILVSLSMLFAVLPIYGKFIVAFIAVFCFVWYMEYDSLKNSRYS